MEESCRAKEVIFCDVLRFAFFYQQIERHKGSMKWKLDRYRFDSQTNVLFGPKGNRLLEPKASALLRYFLENPGRDISRDELIQKVWDGRIVTDGAINRVVVQLRRELGDDEKIKHMIITVPKTGYRFVFEAEVLTTITKATATTPFRKVGLIIAPLVLIWLATMFFWPTGPTNQKNPNIIPLVRLASAQTHAANANHTEQLVYVQQSQEGPALYLAAKAGAPALRIGQLTGGTDAPTWSADNNNLAYRHIVEGTCAVRLLRFEKEVPADDTLLFQCKPSPAISLVFNRLGKRIYFTEQESAYTPYRIFEYDLTSGSRRLIAQPLTLDRGNHHLDRHPVSGDLLLLHDRAPGKTSAFRLKVASSSYEKLTDWSYRVDAAIWGHSDGTIIHPGKHPSYRLLETDLATNKTRTLVSDSRRIKNPARIGNGKDYLFTSYINNQDIALTGADMTAINSSVMDYLATLSRSATQIAFISKRTGKSQIWINDLHTGELRSIDLTFEGQSLRAMEWSFDNSRLMLSTSAGLVIVDVVDGEIIKRISPGHTVYAASWSAEDEIVYSLHQQDGWQIYRHNLKTDTATLENKRWAFMLKNDTREIRIDQNFSLYEGEKEILDEKCASILRLQDLTLRLSGTDLYCINEEKRTNLLRYGPAGLIDNLENAVSSVRHYSVSQGKVARTDLVGAVSDIMRTNYAKTKEKK